MHKCVFVCVCVFVCKGTYIHMKNAYTLSLFFSVPVSPLSLFLSLSLSLSRSLALSLSIYLSRSLSQVLDHARAISSKALSRYDLWTCNSLSLSFPPLLRTPPSLPPSLPLILSILSRSLALFLSCLLCVCVWV